MFSPLLFVGFEWWGRLFPLFSLGFCRLVGSPSFFKDFQWLHLPIPLHFKGEPYFLAFQGVPF